MNGVIGVGQFCELHGPCLVFCTQSVKNEPNDENYNLETHNRNESRAPICDACTSVGLINALISHDDNTSIKFVSTQVPRKHHLQQLLKHACVRSLSCEIAGGGEGGSVCFGDNERGYVISHTFRIVDSQARGFHRWHTVVLLMRDKIQLLSSWSFFVRHIEELAQYLQENALKIYSSECGDSVRATRLQTGRAPRTPPRPLAQLCGLPAVWGYIHTHLAWILQIIPRILQEVSIRRPILEPDKNKIQSLFNKNVNYTIEDMLYLRQIAMNLTEDMFLSVCYCLSTHIQVLIRTNEDEGVCIVNALNILLPPNLKGTSKCVEYMTPDECPLLAVRQDVAVPRTSDKCLRIDVLPAGWFVKWNGRTPEKPGTFVMNIVRAVKDDRICPSALKSHIQSLILHWMNITQTLLWSNSGHNRQLLRILGAGVEDLDFINYWSKYLSM